MVELRALGTVDVLDTETGRSIASVVAQPKRLGLLCYLALAKPPGAHRRDTLVGMFWPESTDDRARHALNQSLHVLRRALGGDVIDTRGEDAVALRADAFRCDATDFEAALDAGDRSAALELYRGELLPGFYVSEAAEFERWLQGERSRLRARAVAAACELAEADEHGSNDAGSAHWWRRALTLDSSNELLLRRLVTSLSRAGDRAGALREYDSFARKLEEEFELTPAPETLALAERVREEPSSESTNGFGGVRAAAAVTSAGAPAFTSRSVERGRSIGLLAAVGLAAILLALRGAGMLGTGDGSLHSARVLITEFENQTSDPQLAPLGRMAADWITQELGRTAFVEVVPPAAVPRGGLSLPSTAESSDASRTLAREMHAGILVSGAVYQQRDSLVIQARIIDVTTGKLLRPTERVAGAASDPVHLIELLRQRVTGALATALDARLSNWASTASQPPSFEAYTLYVEAMDLFFRGGRYVDAAEQFRRATLTDSTFTAPLLWAARAYQWASQPARADSVLRVLERVRESLAPWDRAMLEYQIGMVQGDVPRAYRGKQRVVEIAPGSEWTLELAQMAWWMNRPRETIALLSGLDADRGWLNQAKWRYRNILDNAHHHLGDYSRELATAQRARDPNSEQRTPHELRALAALARIEEVVSHAGKFLATQPPNWASRRSMYHTALELRAHGAKAESAQLLERMLAWYKTAPEEERRGWLYRLDVGAALFAAGRLTESRALFEQLHAEHPDDFVYQGHLGVLAARLGDHRTAARYLAQQEQRRRPYDHGETTVWAAAIAAHLGENERAFMLYRRALDEGFFATIEVHYRPDLEPLHRYPPFLELRRPKG